MLDEAMAQIAERYPGAVVGLMATSGTVHSGVYADAAARAGVDLIVPDVVHQARLMQVVYGERGVKAGFIDGPCRDDLLATLGHLVRRDAIVALLGCTELPLVLPQNEHFIIEGRTVALLDPTLLLAAACVRNARAS